MRQILILIALALVLVVAFAVVNKVKFKSNGKTENDVPESKYQIDVLNACGVKDVAYEVTVFLRKNGFDVIDYGNYPNGFVNESFVIDHVGKPDVAKDIARKLGIKKIVRSKAKYYNEFTVIIGKDYYKLKPFKN